MNMNKNIIKNNVIIVAGGSGKRMGTTIPKQFLLLKGKPILYYTIKQFLDFDNNINIILVLPDNQISHWEKLCSIHNIKFPHTITKGGKERFFSVKNGLKLIQNNGLVGVHDGVRPLVSLNTIKNCYEAASEYGASIPFIDVYETIRMLTTDGSKTVDRDNYKLIQTPQVFRKQILDEAYKQDFKATFTDDASVVESLGYKIHLTPGNRENIKITTNNDLKIAELYLAKNSNSHLAKY